MLDMYFYRLFSGNNVSIKQLKQEKKMIEGELERLNGTTLYIQKVQKWFQFQEKYKGKKISISKDPARIYRNARYMFLESVLAIIDLTLEHCTTAKEWRKFHKIMSRFQFAGLDFDKITLTVEQLKWKSAPASRKPRNPNKSLKEEFPYETPGHLRVRSKSERLIATLLERLHIPFRYEPEIVIDGELLHPDFVILTSDHRYIIIEHCGMMEVVGYISSLHRRTATFAAEHFHIGQAVFLSFESDTVSEMNAEEMIKRALLLPGIPVEIFNKYLTAENWAA